MPTPRPWGAGTPGRETIAAAALRLVDADGIAELSIRRLAAELGVHPTALYRRVASRDEILDLIGDAVLAEIDLASLHGRWSERLLTLAVAYRSAVARHPAAASALNSWTTAQPATAAISETIFDALAEAGLSGRQLLEAYNVYLGYVHGASVTEVLTRPTGTSGLSSPRRIDETLLGRHPRLAAAAHHFAELSAQDSEQALRAAIFRSGVETVIRGLHERYDLVAHVTTPLHAPT